MIRAYSQRLLPPFTGVVQIAESERARAQSFDGINWEVHYLSGNEQSGDKKYRVQGYGLDKGYYNVASIKNQDLNLFNFPRCVNADQVTESVHELTEFLAEATVPFPPGDIFEYWLLDKSDDSPLALICSCCDESLVDTYPGRIEWTAIPHSKMRIENTDAEDERREAPVNHRFQRSIANRAGLNPRAAWFKREQNESGSFPGLLVREDWHDQVDHDLCQRYLTRKAPRLLMLQGLADDERDRMELAAKQNCFEVEEYFPLYPEVNDQRLMTAIRVEARLRRASPQVVETTKKDKPSGPMPLSKDMRIIEN